MTSQTKATSRQATIDRSDFIAQVANYERDGDIAQLLPYLLSRRRLWQRGTFEDVSIWTYWGSYGGCGDPTWRSTDTLRQRVREECFRDTSEDVGANDGGEGFEDGGDTTSTAATTLAEEFEMIVRLGRSLVFGALVLPSSRNSYTTTSSEFDSWVEATVLLGWWPTHRHHFRRLFEHWELDARGRGFEDAAMLIQMGVYAAVVGCLHTLRYLMQRWPRYLHERNDAFVIVTVAIERGRDDVIALLHKHQPQLVRLGFEMLPQEHRDSLRSKLKIDT